MRSVLVTGGAQRLGAALTRAYAARGWQVFCHHQRSVDAAQALVSELSAAGQRVVAVRGDLASEAGCDEVIEQVRQHSDALHCLVNNASLFEPDAAREMDPHVALAQLQVNLVSPLLLSAKMLRDLMPSDAASRPACIVHILDQKVYNLNPDYFSYTLSKLALERAVALQAQALAPWARVCGLAPGLIFTSGPQSSENFEQARRANLLRRPTSVDDVVRACLFLADTPGVNGSTLCVDNGQHLVPLPRDIMFVVDELLGGKAHEGTPT